ncbi:type 1 glutamine amidotransferase domain-containing protein [Dialister sp.]|uniref:type 1 glutamine amidotransferase domain-containing protein n=1 Tax=Dialister sp. TaxID=1955814 RepID=UPI003F1152F8
MKKAFAFLFMIISALLGMVPAQAAETKGKILVIASGEDTMTLKNGSTMNVGFFLNEFAVPSQYLAGEGYEIVLATPEGKKPVMDKSSNDKNFFNGSEERRASAEAFINGLSPISFKEALRHLDEYKAIFIPGGHAPMTDLMQSRDLGEMLRYFHESGKPTAMICHGPVASLAALPQAEAYRKALVDGDFAKAQEASQNWIYKGYHMTVLSDAEEWPGELKKGTEMPFHVEQALQIAGGYMEEGALYQSHVVKDHELITGQNPASDIALAQALAAAIEGR